MELISEPLDDAHIVESFSCGNERLDRWLRDSARLGEQRRTARTYVMHEGDGVVVGYYALAANALHRDSLASRRQRSGLPEEIPAILLAKLAVDESLRGQGYGRDLLLEALYKCVQTGRAVGSRYVVVDAIDDDAASFYDHYGFKAISGSEPHRLVRKLDDIEASFDGDVDQELS